MKKRSKILLSVVCAALAVAAICFFAVYFLFLHRYRGKEIIASWSESDSFAISEIATVEKQKGKPFVILNLADIQLCDLEDIFYLNEMKREITDLVNRAKPDLITLTGDQTWSNENLISLKSLISWLDSFKIPYAPVFGNHDCGNEPDSAVLSRNACCDLYEKGKYSLFRRGPSNLGSLGNYVVNVTEGGKIVKTLYFLDSGYEDRISDEQIAWLQWNAEGLRAANGGEYPAGMCFFHKPTPEFAAAYVGYRKGNPAVEAIGEVYVNDSLSGSLQNGFFLAAKAVGATDLVCGHQHGNCFTLNYEGVRLTFALKTGDRAYYYSDETVTLDGATCFALDGNETEITLLFAKKES